MAALFIDKTLKAGEEGDKVFSFLSAAVNKVLLMARTKGLDSKYQVAELVTRMWLVWSAYERDNNPELLNDLKTMGETLMKLAGP